MNKMNKLIIKKENGALIGATNDVVFPDDCELIDTPTDFDFECDFSCFRFDGEQLVFDESLKVVLHPTVA